MGDVTEIHTWEDLYNIRDYLADNYKLMNDLTPGYKGYYEYASEDADGRCRVAAYQRDNYGRKFSQRYLHYIIDYRR